MSDRTVCEHFNEIGKCADCQQDKLERLRDEFAMAAMVEIIRLNKLDDMQSPAVIARDSYVMADAMMEARKK